MINVNVPFILHAKCTVEYHGRAKSSLQLGDYIIIRKGDGTLLIHGGTLSKPLNYQLPKAIMTKEDNTLISKGNKEVIRIEIESIWHYYEIDNWSTNKVNISMTENDLKKKIINEIGKYITNVLEIKEEFRTPLGIIDIVVISTDHIYHLIEVKRKKANLAACSQIKRYIDYFDSTNQINKGYITCPEISKGAAEYVKNNNIIFIPVHF